MDNPEIAIYVVVDRPNVPGSIMDDAKFATKIVRNILTEVLPYKGIFMTEELSDKEREELEALKIEIMTPPLTGEDTNPEGEEGGSGEAGEGTAGEGGAGETGTGEAGGSGEGGAAAPTPVSEVWKDFPIDPETGYAVDPATGAYVDPESGAVLGGSYEDGVGASPSPGEGGAEGDGAGATPSASPAA